jgi:anthranilate synthase component I
VVMQDGVAYLQAGAGIVADSDPESEHRECLNKLAAIEAAIDLAENEGP